MEDAPPASAGAFSDQAHSYLKLLDSLREAGRHSAATGLGVVRRIAAWIDSPEVLFSICRHPPWYDDWEVKEALLRNDATPTESREALHRQVAVFDLLREMDSPQLTEQDRGEIREAVKSLIQTLEERDRAVVKQRAYELSSSRGEAAPERAAVPPAVPVPAAPPSRGPAVEAPIAEEPAPEVAAEELRPEPPAPSPITSVLRTVEREAIEEAPEAAAPAEDAAGAAAARAAEQQRAHRAATASDRGQLAALVHDPSPRVQTALAGNPALAEDLAAILARNASRQAAEAIYRNRTLFSRPRVQRALLESPGAPAAALLEAINAIGDLSGLLGVVSSPRVRSVEVKAKARARLGEIFRGFSEGEKVAAVRRAGRPLLKELWRDFFRDENLVLRCLKEKQLDEGSVLEIARSSIAPRRALEQIANTPAWTGSYQVTLSLVLNPKTPRQATARLVRRLNPSDRRMVKNNRSLPEFVRRLA